MVVLSLLHQVFAPSDAAFAKLPAEDVAFLTSAEGKASLVQLLSYHVVNTGVVPSYNLLNGATTTVASVEGSDLVVDKSADGQVVTVNGIPVTTPDVLASNGIVHVIDTVLTSPTRR